QIIWRLRAADRYQSAENETGHRVDAGLLGPASFRLDGVDVDNACELRAHLIGVDAALGRRANEDLAVGKIAAFGEIELHEALLHAPRVPGATGPQDQAMAVERVGLTLDLVARIGKPDRCRRLYDTACAVVVALDRAELGNQVLFAG